MKAGTVRLAAIALAFLMVLAVTPSRGQEQAKTADSTEYALALQRGTQAVIWGLPAVSMIDVRKSAERQLGATYNDIIYFSKPMVSRHGFLTANNDVPYAVTLLSTTDGPVVLDVPPASDKTLYYGSAIDAWQVPIVDVGPEGEDRGKGGKYLFLPPGFKGAVPGGYLTQAAYTHNAVAPFRFNRAWIAARSWGVTRKVLRKM